MEITVKIDAPELVSAIYTLATALETWNHGAILKHTADETAATTAMPQPAPAAPTVAPSAAPEQPIQQQQVMTAPAIPVAQPMMTQGATALAPAVAVVPTAAQSYSMEQLAVAATQLVDAGRRMELVQLLGAFGVQALTSLPKEQYGAFATQLRALGAKI